MSAILDPHLRYQYKPGVGSSHYWAEKQLAKISPSTAALDVGSGSGAMGRELRRLGFLKISAIEIDAEARAHVADVYDRIEPSLTAFGSEKFGLVLLLDVLEHMPDPFSFLKAVVAQMSPGGTVLISVPNIAHLTMRLGLLFGFFEYTSRGLLDRTHLQFFNRRRVRALLASCPELQIVEFSCSIEPLELLLPASVGKSSWFSVFSRLRLAVAKLLPGLLGYQHLVCAVKSKS